MRYRISIVHRSDCHFDVFEQTCIFGIVVRSRCIWSCGELSECLAEIPRRACRLPNAKADLAGGGEP